MKRILPVCALALVLSCQGGPEPRSSVPPLPDKGPPLTYAQLLERSRTLAANATAAFYADNWPVLEETAIKLEQSAAYLARAEDVPAKHKDTLPTISADLAKLSRELKDAAKGKEVDKTNEVMKKVNLKVREMRLADGP